MKCAFVSRHKLALLTLAAVVTAGMACQEVPSTASVEKRILRIATTTSVENTGLMALLSKPFEERYGVTVQVVAVGSGQALKLAKNGDVDMVLTHDPDAEEAFVKGGWGLGRIALMQNDFVIVGPAADPAQVAGAKSPEEAFSRIAATKSGFISRGDKSGTHLKELALWATANIKPEGDWYIEAGQGQRLTLEMADQKAAYALVDSATMEFSKQKLKIVTLYQNPGVLLNPYSAIVVSPGAHPQANIADAHAFVGWMLSDAGRAIIKGFQVEGKTLFVPHAYPTPKAEK